MAKELRFTFRGELYRVDESGRIQTKGNGKFSDTWGFLGGSSHHWMNRISVTRTQAFSEPEKLNGCLGWDRDHGSTRMWGGQYNGKLPRITGAHVVDVE